MTRTFFALAGLVLLIFCSTPDAHAANLCGHEIVFTGCPPYVAGSHCDSMFYQVVAVDIATGERCPRVRYLKVSGPGEVDRESGLWIYHPDFEDSIPHNRPIVEIAAFIGADTTPSEDNCSFGVVVRDHKPSFDTHGRININVLPGETASRKLTVSDRDPCDVPLFVEMQVSPTPAGDLTFDPEAGVITFTPASVDSGKSFMATLLYKSGPAHTSLLVHFTVFERPPVAPPYSVRIETLNEVACGTLVHPAVVLESIDPDEGIGAFDLLIGYDASVISFISASEGDIYAQCGWEYFTFRLGPDGVCESACPNGMLNLTGIADKNDGPYNHPTCNDGHPGYVETESLPVTLANLTFLTTANQNVEGIFSPLSFFWMECQDNVISNSDGSEVYLSAEVHSPFDTLLTCAESFPTFCGSRQTLDDENCYYEDTIAGKYALADIEYHNGGLAFKKMPPIDSRGDINCNLLPYEMADLLEFVSLYVSGGGLFGTAPPCATHDADANLDNTPWTVADYQYLKDVVAGYPVPWQAMPAPGTTHFVVDSRGNLSIDREIAALGLVLDGNVEVSDLAESLKATRGVVTNDTITVTIVLVENEDWSGNIAPGLVLRLPVGATILQASASTFEGAVSYVKVETITGLNQYAVAIGAKHATYPGEVVDLDVTLWGIDPLLGLGGFDLTVGYQEEGLAFQSANAGDLFDACGWEYYSFVRSNVDSIDANGPTSVIKMIGLAELVHGSSSACFVNGYDDASLLPITIATLRFRATEEPTWGCHFAPVRFYWTSCSDNVLTSSDGSQSFFSAHVYGFYDYNRIFDAAELTGTYGIPTYYGTESTLEAEGCFGSYPWVPNPSSKILFQGGGVEIPCDPWPDNRGDINLNGYAYEVADAAMFTNYLINGVVAFGTHVEGSTAASDINANGIPLELADFVLLIRIIVGNAVPYPYTAPVPGTLHRGVSDDQISITSDHKTCALYLTVDGEITPVLLDLQMEMSFAADAGTTRLIIMTDSLNPMAETPFLVLPGAGAIAKAEATTYVGRPIALSLNQVTDVADHPSGLPTEYSLGVNYPNPFNPSTTIQYALPEVATVEIVIYNVMGQTVRTLDCGTRGPGEYEVEWDGRDVGGAPAASGIYFYRMIAGDFTQSRKMLLLK